MSIPTAKTTKLAAIFGFVNGISVILLAPVVGGWIDRTKRITGATTFLLVQNIAVALVMMFDFSS